MSSSSANIGSDLLWHKCVGHTVKVPRVGDRIFYFPQGHVEHVVACMNEQNITNIRSDGLPSKILCRVVDVSLKAEPVTENLYAKLTLRPIVEEHELDRTTTGIVPENRHASISFCKMLTNSDVSTNGGLILPKTNAEDTFPFLGRTQDSFSQNLVVKDLHGATWHFQHVYRGAPNSQRHYLTSGWNKFVTEKGLVAGDTCIFLSCQDKIYVGIRRAVRMQSQPPRELPCSGIISGLISHARIFINERTDLTVFYHPRERASPFVVDYDKVMESLNANYSPGMRIKMFSDGGKEYDDNVMKTLTGIITDVEDMDPYRWRNSEWRCLRIRWSWGARYFQSVLPHRVSPWSIQPFHLEMPHQ